MPEEEELETSDTDKKRNKGAGFFAIDRRTWGAVCECGEMAPAVAYLVLAQGTGHTNATTKWSVTSLKTWAGIDWERGKLAIQKLIDWGFLRKGKDHTVNKPRYELATWSEVFPRLLDSYELPLLKEIRAGGQPYRPSRRGRQALAELERKGILFQKGNGYFENSSPADEGGKDDLIWLPNSLVTGSKEGEKSPVQRLRSGGNLWTLRLLVDLYHAQNLRADAGISPYVIREIWDRKSVGQQGVFIVWAFRLKNRELHWTGPLIPHRSRPQMADTKDHPIWESIKQLENQGLLTFVPHLWESEQPDAEPIHAYGIQGRGGEPLEIEIGTAAHRAGIAMGYERKIEAAEDEGFRHLSPARNTLPNVQMVGIARLTYRPHTKRTKDWWRELQGNAQIWIANYQRMCPEFQKAVGASTGFNGSQSKSRF